jgi:hypothetical protein
VSSLGDRYPTSYSFPTKLLLGLGAVIIVILAGWLVWAIWFHGHAKVSSELEQNYAVDDNHYSVTVQVHLDGVAASEVSCSISAVAKNGTIVGGPKTYTPTGEGAQTFILDTTSRAVYATWDGCTAPGQDDPR